MPVKTSVKKAPGSVKRPVKKTVKKTAKKAAWDEIQAGFKKLQKSQDEAWAAIRKTQQAHEETEKVIRETHENIFGLNKAKDEAWKAIKETHENIFGLNKAKDEAWKAIRETQKNIGGLNNTLGSMVEHILTPGLPKKFKKFGYSFTRIASYRYAAGVWAQIDGMLENGTQAMAIEVKMTLKQADIDDHLVRMEKVRKFADEHGDDRQFIGAIAAINTDESTRNYALKKGLFVIEPSGEDVKVTKPEKKVKVW